MPSKILMVLRKVLVLAVAAAWVVSSICDARSGVLLMPSSQKFTFFATVPFDTASATEKSYRSFISHLREEMGVRDKVHGIPRLYSAKDLSSESNRYLQVALYNTAGNRITLALDRVTANVVAYRTDVVAYFFQDTITDITKNLFYSIPRKTLPFNSTYSSMESFAGIRSTVDLGMYDLDDSIQYLYNRIVAKFSPSLLIASQMIADALRYRYVEDVVVQHIPEEPVFKPPEEMINFEDHWIQLSTSIQQSLGDVITPAFQPTKTSEPITTIYPTLGLNFGVMLYVCDNCTHQREVAPIHLIGRNGLCVDLQDGLSYDGNAVILLPCSDSSKTQQWTAMLNGTIQSMGKCLAAYRLKAERYVMIHDCTYNLPSHSDIKWEVQDSGNIVNKKFNLALNAFTGDIWSVLTVEQSLYQSRQRWTFTNSTKPFVTTIKSYNDKCIEASNNFSTVQIVNCSESVQSWKLYPDGTVRPSHEYMTTKCLTYKITEIGKTVILLPCNGGGAERWRLHHDYSISDETNKNVLEINEAQKNIMVVKRYSDAPTNKQIFKIQSTNWS